MDHYQVCRSLRLDSCQRSYFALRSVLDALCKSPGVGMFGRDEMQRLVDTVNRVVEET